MTVRFTIEETFDLPSRGGILASGRLLEGSVQGGMTLRDEATDQPVTVLAVEFLTPATGESGRTTLVIDRSTASAISRGSVLTSAE